ncbi:FecR/PupR family sigma factor regulator [Aurantiacibacter gilvus]|uniref:FecR/PupR family sigma factor regulator n=1 Tax=Aurantiacibacter gilvus TaxID=3139141 RepID=A0ABU9IG60_9SPHN
MTKRLLIALVVLAGLAVGTALLFRDRLHGLLVGDDTNSHAAFERWLAADAEHGQAFGRFETFLQSQGVSGVVPDWQLLRIDTNLAARCDQPSFAVPPEGLWPRIVPALRLVRDRVEPLVGEVEVLSAFRPTAINTCVGGASGSKHMAFAALDLATVDRQHDAAFFTSLCAMQARAGPASRMGLGAYFDPADPDRAHGRFHIDGEGFRNWGFDYTSRSSPCPLFEAQETGDNT